MLDRLIQALETLDTAGMFTFSVLIVDNDARMSARDTVEKAKQTYDLKIAYLVESEQNISLARNKAVENAKGDFIAFIDDDEFPDSGWLKHHYLTLRSSGADGSFGPVMPYFDGEPPKWLIDGGFCERPFHETGTVLDSSSCRTGNVLVLRDLFTHEDNRFDPRFGRSGGEDNQFFLKMILTGRKFVWCNEAPVHEVVPPERWKASYYIRRQLRIGGVYGEFKRKNKIKESLARTIKTVLYFHLYLVFYSITTLPSFLVRRDVGIKCLVKAAYASGFVFGFWGLVFIREKNE